MQCREIRELLARNALTPAERAIVEKHLASCPSCRKDAQRLSQTLNDLKTLKEEVPPLRLYRFFSNELHARKQKRRKSPLIFWQSTLGVIASSVFLLIVLLIIMMNLFHSSPAKSPSILIQIFPQGHTVETFHPARSVLIEETGKAVTLHLIIDDNGKVEKILSMESKSKRLRRIYGKLLPLWRFDVPHRGDYLLIITIPNLDFP